MPPINCATACLLKYFPVAAAVFLLLLRLLLQVSAASSTPASSSNGASPEAAAAVAVVAEVMDSESEWEGSEGEQHQQTASGAPKKKSGGKRK